MCSISSEQMTELQITLLSFLALLLERRGYGHIIFFKALSSAFLDAQTGTMIC